MKHMKNIVVSELMGCRPDFKVFERAEDIALEKYSNGKYPKVFPWLKNLNI